MTTILRELLISNDVTLGALAESTGISPHVLECIAYGTCNNMRCWTMIKICNYFDVSPNELLGWDN